MIDLYSRWGNYIPSDLRKQFENECLSQEQLKADLEKLCKLTRQNTNHLSDDEIESMYGEEGFNIIMTN